MAPEASPWVGSLRHPGSKRSHLPAYAGCCRSARGQGIYPCSRQPWPGRLLHHHHRQEHQQQQQQQRPGRRLVPVRAAGEEIQRGLVEVGASQTGWLAGLGKPVLQSTLASLLAYLAAAWPDRPRGWSRRDLLEVRSTNPRYWSVTAQLHPLHAVAGWYHFWYPLITGVATLANT